MGQAEGREGLIEPGTGSSAPACTGAHAPTCVYTLTHGGMGWEAHLGHGAQPAKECKLSRVIHHQEFAQQGLG